MRCGFWLYLLLFQQNANVSVFLYGIGRKRAWIRGECARAWVQTTVAKVICGLWSAKRWRKGRVCVPSWSSCACPSRRKRVGTACRACSTRAWWMAMPMWRRSPAKCLPARPIMPTARCRPWLSPAAWRHMWPMTLWWCSYATCVRTSTSHRVPRSCFVPGPAWWRLPQWTLFASGM